MLNLQRRHDISDEMWAIIKPHLPGQKGQWGGIAKDNRKRVMPSREGDFSVGEAKFCRCHHPYG